MATLGTLYALVVLYPFLFSKTMATTVEVTVPVHPVKVGGILPIQCQIWNMEDGYTVRMFRVINGQTDHLTTEMIYFPSPLEQRVFVTKRSMPGGILVYFMTIIDASYDDQGEYLCKVYRLSGGDYIKVTEGSTDVEIYFLPNSMYPHCQSEPAVTENMKENVQLKLKCISSNGAPTVELRWIDNSNQEISSRNNIKDGTVSSEITLTTSTYLHSTLFVCEMTSPGFQNFKRTCKIGPITIKRNAENTAMTQPIIPIATDQTAKDKIIISNECNTECSSDNKYMILYLSIATVVATMLCIVFLTTTIIWCYKYHNISSEISDTPKRNITTCDGSEPVYVSLQRRPEPVIPERRSIYKEPDRSSLYSAPERKSLYKESDTSSTTYMSVEDPNNPGSKVLMPKEVFEEFYNSLRLKEV